MKKAFLDGADMSSQPNGRTTAGMSAAAARMAWPAFGTAGCDARFIAMLRADIDARVDLADHSLLILLKTWFECADQMPEQLRAAVQRTITGFRFNLDEPGSDSMCTWTESHYVAFATCEYLAGKLFPSETFANDGQPGQVHKQAAEVRLRVWLHDRFRWGFGEWLSSSYYTVDIAALSLIVDWADAPDLRRGAAIVLDLFMLDMALHRFDGHFVAASARSTALQLQRPSDAPVQTIVDNAFGTCDETFQPYQLAAIFCHRSRYEVPQTLREIAASPDVFRIHTSQGLNVEEVPDALSSDSVYPRASAQEQLDFWWSMQVFTAPPVVNATVKKYRAAHLDNHDFLAALGQLARIPSALRRASVRVARPTSDGMAVQRGNVQTFRTPYYLLSSAQRYHPGEFGDQQHLWQACLPGNISIFGNHPVSRTLHTQSYPEGQQNWIGNGINPDIAQADDVLLVQYDLRGRQGRFEGPRQLFTHIYFPFVDFDESTVGDRWVAGHRAGSYVGVLATSPLDLISETEIVQRGVRTGYAVIVGDEREFGSLGGFVRQLKECRISLKGGRLRLTTYYGDYELEWGADFTVNGQKADDRYPRYSCQAAEVAREPTLIRVEGSAHRLQLDWSKLGREESPSGRG